MFKKKTLYKVLYWTLFVCVLYLPIIHISDLYIFYKAPLVANPSLCQKVKDSQTLPIYSHTRMNHPEVYIVKIETGEEFIIKQIKGDSWKEKLICRFILAHEFSILRSIQDMPNVSRLAGKIDNNTFAIEYIYSKENHEFSLEALSSIKKELFTILERLHQRYIYHKDLGHFCNVVISLDGRANLIDFGGSLQLDPITGSLVGPILAYKERLRLLRMMFRIQPESLTSKEFKELFIYISLARLFNPSNIVLKQIQEYRHAKKNANLD